VLGEPVAVAPGVGGIERAPVSQRSVQQVERADRTCGHNRQQQPAGHEQPAEPADRGRKVRRQVEDVRRDDEVDASIREALVSEVAVEIALPHFYERIVGEARADGRERGRRDIGRDVLGAMTWQHRQRAQGHRARAGAHFEDADGAVAWQGGGHRPHRGACGVAVDRREG